MAQGLDRFVIPLKETSSKARTTDGRTPTLERGTARQHWDFDAPLLSPDFSNINAKASVELRASTWTQDIVSVKNTPFGGFRGLTNLTILSIDATFTISIL